MKKAREYSSSVIEGILSETNSKEKRKISKRMRLAAKIADAMNAKGWNNNRLMEEMGKNSASIVSRWLSGTHNFTSDTLFDLEEVLKINLLNLEDKKVQTIQVFHFQASQTASTSQNLDNTETINNAIDFPILISNGFENNEYRA